MQQFEGRLTAVEVTQRTHEKHCDERAERTDKNLERIANTADREQQERREAVARLHNRTDAVVASVAEISTDIAVVKDSLDKLPQLIAEQIKNSSNNNRLWAYSKTAGLIGMAGGAVAFIFDHMK